MLKNGQSSRLNQKRLKLLNEIGFVWEVDRANSRQRKKAVLKNDPSNNKGRPSSTIGRGTKEDNERNNALPTLFPTNDVRETFPEASSTDGRVERGLHLGVTNQGSKQMYFDEDLTGLDYAES